MAAYYSNTISGFLSDTNAIIGDSLVKKSIFSKLLKTQIDSWETLINVLKKSFQHYHTSQGWGILLEYSIPRRSKRIDCVILTDDLIIVIEFKDGNTNYLKADCQQLEDYCLDLNDFHYESRDRLIIPILLSTSASNKSNDYTSTDTVKDVLFSNQNNLAEVIHLAVKAWGGFSTAIHHSEWNDSQYFPTPTIIEAAQKMFADKNVEEIARAHADANNLKGTTTSIIEAIKEAQKTNSKIICFITGVPGAGKTLAGLNIVHNKEFKTHKDELGIFLSGNSPLVKVLTEALARDYSKRQEIPKSEARRKVTTFIQNVHQFIDDYHFDDTRLPVDRVLIYDEAQRAWTKEHKNRKSEGKINVSEPEILLSIMNRFQNSWSVIVALIGGGQEINTGEGGLLEWGKSLSESYKDWKIYISPELKLGNHSTGNQTLFKNLPTDIEIFEDKNLHLKVGLRSFKAEKLSDWVSLTMSNKPNEANKIYKEFLKEYPLFITRSFERAKTFLKKKARGTRRCGLVASSGGRRLRAVGVDINSGLKGTSTQQELGDWYLNPSSDVRSSNFLEVVSSEFAIQGLELDWIGLCWDADLRRLGNTWDCNSFRGDRWNKIRKEEMQMYLINKYRVLLTRAREGMIIYIPYGSEEDETRKPSYYDLTYQYLKECGVRDLL